MHGYREWPFGPHKGGPRWRFEEDAEERERPARRLRELEPWEDDNEMLDGADALEDLVQPGAGTAEAARMVARFATVRFALGATSGCIPEWLLDHERRAAAEYVLYPSATSREAAALAAVVRLAAPDPPREIAAHLCDAADAAAERTHEGGARSLYRAAYIIAVERGWSAEAARAAGGMERLAQLGGGRWSQRLWRRRGLVLRRRAAREAAAEVDAG
ncbi:MAG: hypothetical protein IRZ00_17230 [Gemmatimonadetes bacterium]|nr:hypothetical protein [Gemmatimonadota bacterium]